MKSVAQDRSGFTADDLGDSIIWTLPCRDVSQYRFLGWIAVAVSGMGMAFAAAFALGPLVAGIGMLKRGQNAGWISIAFAAFSSLGGFFTLKWFHAGIAILRNQSHCVIELRGDSLQVCEHFGRATFRRKTKASTIDALELGPYKVRETSGEVGWVSGFDETDALAAKTSDGTFPVAIGYAQPLLQELANSLRDQLSRAQQELKVVTSADWGTPSKTIRQQREDTGNPIAIEVREETPNAEVPDLPSESDILRHESDGMITFEIPPSGVWKSNKGLLFFAVIWNGFMFLFTLAMLFAEDNWDNVGAALPIVVFLICFGAQALGYWSLQSAEANERA